jgi:hypothetical protein
MTGRPWAGALGVAAALILWSSRSVADHRESRKPPALECRMTVAEGNFGSYNPPRPPARIVLNLADPSTMDPKFDGGGYISMRAPFRLKKMESHSGIFSARYVSEEGEAREPSRRVVMDVRGIHPEAFMVSGRKTDQDLSNLAAYKFSVWLLSETSLSVPTMDGFGILECAAKR